MPRSSRVDETVEVLSERIVDGTYPVGAALPGQAELAQTLNVSRLTVREAISVLANRGMVQVVHGTGTFVQPAEQWTSLASVFRAASHVGDADSPAVPLALIEVRRIIEVGAVQLCAGRRDEAQLRRLYELTDAMETAAAQGDVDAFVTCDIAFHATILEGCHNPFLAVVYSPLQDTLQQARVQTSLDQEFRQHALVHHRRIADAIAARDPQAAGEAMTGHITQTADDLTTVVFGHGPAAERLP